MDWGREKKPYSWSNPAVISAELNLCAAIFLSGAARGLQGARPVTEARADFISNSWAGFCCVNQKSMVQQQSQS
jgi:hypothetical protein